jgi:hypothetical protein
LSSVSVVVKVFDATRDQRMFGAKLAERFVERGAIDVRDDRDIVARTLPPERVDEQVGTERGTADPDMQKVPDFAECAGFDRIDHHPHPLVQRLRGVDRLRRPSPRSALCSAARPSVGLAMPPENSVLRRPGEVLHLGQAGQDRDRRTVEMRLGEVEADVGDVRTST